MNRMEKIYKDASGIDIRDQERLWDEQGKGYFGEYRVFNLLFEEVPGQCKLLTNVKIPGTKSEKTEIDLILIHEIGLICFEVKHYKGTITGKISDRKWTQSFRTEPDSTFLNPVTQNEELVKALSSRFPGIPIWSFIVFTHDEAKLKVTGSMPHVYVCSFDKLKNKLLKLISTTSTRLGTKQIDQTFTLLFPFAPGSNRRVSFNKEVVPFYQFFEMIRENLEDFKEQCEEEYEEEKDKLRKKARKYWIIPVITSVIVDALAIGAMAFYCFYK